MTNSTHIKLLATAAAALAAGGVVATTGSAQDPPPTLELVQRSSETRSAFVDNPPRRRESRGDMFTLSGPVRDAAGRRVGRAEGAFVLTTAKRAQGSATLLLDSGRLVIEGAVGPGRVSELAIVGGTGAYSSARGSVEVTETRRATRLRLTLAP